MQADTPDGAPARAPEVLTIGETLIAVRSQGPLAVGGPAALSVAGAESNVAIGVARLGHSARWLGVLGDDAPGRLVRRTLRAEAVDLSTTRVDPNRPTGLLMTEPRIAGLTRVLYYRTGSAGSGLEPADVARAFDAVPAVLHVTGITPALGAGPRAAIAEAVVRARQSGVRVCLDVNYRSQLWSRAAATDVLHELVPSIDILVASDDELTLVGPGGDERKQVDALRQLGPSEVVVKRGPAGATVYHPDGEVSSPAWTVPVVDVIGAGDAFVAGYLSGLLDGLVVADRLARATATAAFVVASTGDWEGLPTRAELALVGGSAAAVLR